MRRDDCDILLDPGDSPEQRGYRPGEEGGDHKYRTGGEGECPRDDRKGGLPIAVEQPAGHNTSQSGDVGERLRDRRRPTQIVRARYTFHCTYLSRSGRSMPGLFRLPRERLTVVGSMGQPVTVCLSWWGGGA